MRGTAGLDTQRQRLLVGLLLIVALLFAVAATTVASHGEDTSSAAPDGPHPSTTSTTALGSSTTDAPTTTAAPTSTTAAVTAPTTAPTAAAPAGPADDDGGDSHPSGDGTPTSPPPPPKGDCGGQQLLKPDGSAWTCSFDDEFAGTAVNPSLWRIQETSWNGYHVGSECMVNSPNNVAVGDGALHLTVRKEAHGFICHAGKKPYSTPYTGGMVLTFGKFTQAFGRWDIRAKFPAVTVKGVQSSFWLWPQDPSKYGVWPGSGEIDLTEYYSQWPDRVIPYVHYTGSAYNVTNEYCMVKDPSDWHDYVMTWTRTAISISVDGRNCLYTKIDPTFPMQAPAPFDQPFMLALTQGLGVRGNAFNPASTPLPATTTVDYVRVWK